MNCSSTSWWTGQARKIRTFQILRTSLVQNKGMLTGIWQFSLPTSRTFAQLGSIDSLVCFWTFHPFHHLLHSLRSFRSPLFVVIKLCSFIRLVRFFSFPCVFPPFNFPSELRLQPVGLGAMHFSVPSG